MDRISFRSTIRQSLRRVRYFGWLRYCPLCRSPLQLFFAHGVVPRPNAVCPVCKSRDRHRLAWLYLRQVLTEPPFPKDFLHLAPEPQLARRLAALPQLRYRAGGLGSPPLEWMDITALPLPAGSQDFIYCSHVLNMLPSDREAMTELRRVLRLAGCALLQVPVQRGANTVELAASASEAERLAAFGDPGMYRRYGSDLRSRLEAAGFKVEVLPLYQMIPERQRRRLGLIDEDLYLCRPR